MQFLSFPFSIAYAHVKGKMLSSVASINLIRTAVKLGCYNVLPRNTGLLNSYWKREYNSGTRASID